MKIDWSRHRSYVYGTWEPEVVSALKRLVRSGQCVIDVGAHIGFYTLIFSRFVGPQGRVLAFEPLPWNFSVLCENIALNHIGHAEAINRALLDRTCDLEAKIPDDEPLPGSVPYAESGTKHATARAVSLDEYLGGSRDHVHFIKMDVEGSESLVLAGASQTIEASHPAMIIEVHHFDRSSPDSSPVIGQLRTWGYKTTWLSRWTLTSHLLAV